MKIFLNENVWEASLKRIEYIFDEFKNVVISFSGGKDSTVTLELALIVARKKNRLPLKVYFLDQEAEWGSVIKYVKSVMYRKEIDPLWIQVPIFLPNSISQEEAFLVTWEEGKEWMREKDPIAIKEGHVLKGKAEKEAKTGYWYTYFVKSLDQLFPDEPCCFLAGMRAEESPQRLAGLTTGQTYKAITWGRKLNERKKHFTFYPIYDWAVSDVWKSIHNNNWDYCKIYDEYFRYGLPIKDMRVSNLHHESAVKSLFYLHEIEGKTWEKLNKRLDGINQANHLGVDEILSIKKLPFMFPNWKVYRDFLTQKLIKHQAHRDIFETEWSKMDKLYDELRNPEEMYKKQIKSLLVNDIEFAKLSSYLQSPPLIVYRDWKKGLLKRRVRNPSTLKQVKEKYLIEEYGRIR
jgi:predicted phosphoadenosine phosphosulfate sulfurtransferase|tara:strand:+ start:5335 stop:6549 length:1215 start_codon:yes stop_codon:yes gene_type:complete